MPLLSGIYFPAQWAKSPKKQSGEVYFDNIARYFECRFNKNALLQTFVFLAILPTGRSLESSTHRKYNVHINKLSIYIFLVFEKKYVQINP